MTISLAFLAPDLVKAAIEGRLPYGMGLTRLCELPAKWSRQFRILGLPAPETPELSLRKRGLRFLGNGILRAETDHRKLPL